MERMYMILRSDLCTLSFHCYYGPSSRRDIVHVHKRSINPFPALLSTSLCRSIVLELTSPHITCLIVIDLREQAPKCLGFCEISSPIAPGWSTMEFSTCLIACATDMLFWVFWSCPVLTAQASRHHFIDGVCSAPTWRRWARAGD